ncbi:unnamed protein product [Prorocentrum cordatum]|uniref:Phospholipase B-like n=1 Tax=Prorocentrum cordatum TaxID=2364126 RepID=A0ABN9X6T0_9DINO|nr:unnamed protein product [Polarella glacialis]
MVAIVLTVTACLMARSRALVVKGEGDALTTELAEEVLANPEQDLPPPWDVIVNTPSDRDVGTVTEHPFAPAYELEVAESSLETTGTPAVAIRRILVAETRNATQPPPSYRTGGVGGRAVRHLNGVENPTGATTVWGWQRHRYFALKAWMDTKGDADLMAVHASGDPGLVCWLRREHRPLEVQPDHRSERRHADDCHGRRGEPSACGHGGFLRAEGLCCRCTQDRVPDC